MIPLSKLRIERADGAIGAEGTGIAIPKTIGRNLYIAPQDLLGSRADQVRQIGKQLFKLLA